ncbi:MAG TPA: glutamate--tRNA ligase family protein [Anaerovoracaceae bacterium]|nr:glutamate--tRNA ligase family protein [Anaerovoracaceae bacterium]
MNNKNLAELLFPHIGKKISDYDAIYPERILPGGAKVTRLGPSPTGFIHLGNLYGAFVDERLATQSDGVFFLRIEDTDDKRQVEGSVEVIINSLKFFGIKFDEGVTIDGSVGEYGPYYQSKRGPIYQCFAKELVEKGLAYPCFLNEEEITLIKEEQEKTKQNPGIYGKWAKNRELTYDGILSNIEAGKPYVIRLKSQGNPDALGDEIKTISIEDGIRGTLVMPENIQDIVILKATGIPTYHFAHVVDDHLMRTTHVVRGAEWLSSLPVHVELFNVLSLEMPVFCHTAQLMKLDEEGNKRKLSKRLDPELSLEYYKSKGYHPKAVREYLLTILNSNFEEWRIVHPDLPMEEFSFTIEKMSNSGALFDLNKLNDISKDVLVRISAEELYAWLKEWASEFHSETNILFENNEEYFEKILNLGRSGDKPRKDLIYASQIFEFISYFFDDYFKIEDKNPENISDDDAKLILKVYLESYDHNDDQSAWFDKIRTFGTALGYAAKPKDYKKNPELYKGHVGDVSTVIRIAVMGRSQSPDVWEIQQILGEEKTKNRILKQL